MVLKLKSAYIYVYYCWCRNDGKGLYNRRHDWCFWRSLVSGSVLFFVCRPLLPPQGTPGSLPSCSGREWRARSGLTCRGYTSPSGAAVTVAAAFTPASTGLCLHSQDTLTIFPKSTFPTLFHSSRHPSLPPSFFSFLPFLSLLPSPPPLTSLLASLPHTPSLHPCTEWASSMC